MENVLSLTLSFNDSGIGKISKTNFHIQDTSYMSREEASRILENHTEYSYHPKALAAYRILKMLKTLATDDAIILPIDLDESCSASSPEGTYKYLILSE